MIVDSSALLAILLSEPDRATFWDAITASFRARLPTSCYLEAALKVEHTGVPSRVQALDPLIADLGLTIVPFDAAHAQIAREAFRRFGRGGHALNFGDCMVYAVAKLADAPLLYKGQDFALTDIRAAL